MNKAKIRDREIAEEYDFSRGRRGVYYERARRGMHVEIVSDAEDMARRNKTGKAPKEHDRD